MKDEEITREQLISELKKLRKKNSEMAIIKRELNESKRKHETLLSNLPGMVYRCLHDEDWTLEYVSEGCKKLTGYNSDDLVGNRTVSFAKDIIHPEDLEVIGVDVDSALSEEGPFTCIYRIITADGNTKWVWEQGRGVFASDGRLLAIEGFIVDVTEQKKLEEEFQRVQKLESLGILAGGIAHDFNNLLTGIIGNISLAKDSINPDDKVYQKLVQAEKASLRAGDLTQSLLTFSKGGAPVKETTFIGGLIEDSTDFSLRGSNVICDLSIVDDLWPVEVDEGQISQVINNLLINADQAMPDGGTIKVRCENITVGKEDTLPIKKGKYVKIEIADQGAGISREDLQKIFDPYFTTKEKGRGLGLATSYSIIKKHRGLITVVSEIVTGTTFYIYLPASKKKVLDRNESEKLPLTGEGRILVMDDEAVVRDVAVELLRQLGYEAEFAKDGEDAIEIYTRERASSKSFDVVIMDLTIPGGFGGKETIKKLLKIDPDVKAIVSSGYSNDPIMSSFGEYGFKGVVAKPYRLSKLSEIVHRVIKGEI